MRKPNVIIPMAGVGSRMRKAGYYTLKPLISVGDKLMVQVAVEQLGFDPDKHSHTIAVRPDHRARYNLDHIIERALPKAHVVSINPPGNTGPVGPAVTVLDVCDPMGKNQLIIANCDQVLIGWDSSAFLGAMGDADGGLVVFRDTNPKWSFVAVDEDGYVTRTTEKDPISDYASAGVYYFRLESDYQQYACAMIDNGITVNDEYYIAPVYNEMIKEGKKIKIFEIDGIHDLGSPEGLQEYLRNGLKSS